jgi:hypothetical protein
MAIRVQRRDVREPRVQVSTRVTPELAKRLKVYAVTHDLLVTDLIEAGIKAVLGEKSAA